MKYENTVSANFISRPNRFVAEVALDGHAETVHVKNTGRCRELLLPGAEVILQRSSNPERKTTYDLTGVYKEGLGWVNIDSQAPNAVVKEWLEARPELFADLTLIRPEYVLGKSRIDFCLECPERKILMEVKGCTLEINGTGYFPDAPTERGIRHLEELSDARRNGWECFIAFVIAMPGVREVLPNMVTHPQFGEALEKAEAAGVKVLYLPCEVTENTLRITEAIIKK